MTATATPADQRYLATLRSHWKAHKSFPSLAKLADQLGMSSTGSVFEMVARLEDAGYLTKKEGRVAPGKRFFAYLRVAIDSSPQAPQTEPKPALSGRFGPSASYHPFR